MSAEGPLTCLSTRSVPAKIASKVCIWFAGFLVIVAFLPAQRINAAPSVEVSFCCNTDIVVTLKGTMILQSSV